MKSVIERSIMILSNNAIWLQNYRGQEGNSTGSLELELYLPHTPTPEGRHGTHC